MKLLLPIFFFLPLISFAQPEEFIGYSYQCSKDGYLPRKGEFQLTKTKKLDRVEFLYHYSKIYYIQEGDTSNLIKTDLKQLVTFTYKDSSIQIQNLKDSINPPRKLNVIRRSIDENIIVSSLFYAYDDPDDPDNQVFYIFHPEYGMMMNESKAWFWKSYFYLEGENWVKEVKCE
jgi:hypothetical protein